MVRLHPSKRDFGEIKKDSMLYLSLFLAGFTLGIFAALKIFAPESREETWDSQYFPQDQKLPEVKESITFVKPRSSPLGLSLNK